MSRLYNRSYDSPSRLRNMAQIDVADENLVKLLQIQHVVNTEDELESSLDEVLTRVLDFYRMFVQARNRARARATKAS